MYRLAGISTPKRRNDITTRCPPLLCCPALFTQQSGRPFELTVVEPIDLRRKKARHLDGDMQLVAKLVDALRPAARVAREPLVAEQRGAQRVDALGAHRARREQIKELSVEARR